MDAIIKSADYAALKLFSIVGGGVYGFGLLQLLRVAYIPFAEDQMRVDATITVANFIVSPIAGIIGATIA